MDQLNVFTQNVEDYTETVMTNPYVMAVLKVSLILYAARIAPNPPQYLQDLLKNVFFKIGAIAMILYFVELDFQLALILAIIYVLGMNVLSGRGVFESFAEFKSNAEVKSEYTLISPQTMVYPGCANVKLTDLLAMFEGDKSQLQQAAQLTFQQLMFAAKDKPAQEQLERLARATGLPYNMDINDETAPYVATLFVNYNATVNDSCQPPQ
jgi:hypothetical protein